MESEANKIWVYKTIKKGFEGLAESELGKAGLTKVSQRFFIGERFDLESSSYASFFVTEVSRGNSAEEAIINFDKPIQGTYRVEKMKGKRREGSRTYATIAHKHLGGELRVVNPDVRILVFTPDNKIWIAGFVTEKNNSVIESLDKITERTCVSLTSRAALALVNLTDDQPIIDPCCGTGLIPLASKLRGKETYTADNHYRMIRLARTNRDILGIDLEIPFKDALEPWKTGGCLITDFPAERSWTSTTENISLEIFKAWLPHIDSFCVIFPNRVMDKLPREITIDKMIDFTADRTIVLGRP